MFDDFLTYKAGVFLPFLQAIVIGIPVFVISAAFALLLNLADSGVIGLLAGGLATLAGWVKYRATWQAALLTLANVNLDSRPEPEYYEPEPAAILPARETLRLDVLNQDGSEGDFLELPASREQLIRLAGGLMRGDSFSVAGWTGRGRPFSRSQFENLRNELLARGYLRWVSEHGREQGVSLTGKGTAIMRYFSTVEALPTPPPGRKR